MKKDKFIILRVQQDTRDTIVMLASSEGVTISEYVRDLIEKEIEKN